MGAQVTEDLTKALRDSVILGALEAAERYVIIVQNELIDGDQEQRDLEAIREAIALVKQP
jgi:hypothetical protein